MRSKAIWFVLLLLLLFAFWIASGASGQTIKGAEALMIGAHDSYMASIVPPLPKLVMPPPTQTVTLAWDPSPGTNQITNYAIYWGQESGVYGFHNDVGTNLTASIAIPKTRPWHFAATAKDRLGQESDFSKEAILLYPPTNLVVTVSCSFLNWPPYVVTNPAATYFYRMAATKAGNKWRVVGQRSSSVRGGWVEWSYWPAFTNTTTPANVRVFVRKEMK